MRFGIVILPQESWADARRTWQRAEELGFDHAWTYDHLAWRSLADQPWHATMPALTAAAMVTERIRLGTFVSSPNFRHPVPFAKEIATVDDIAGGRFVLGVGSGGTGFDAFVTGQPAYTPAQRHERFAEFVTGLDVLLRHEGQGQGPQHARQAEERSDVATDAPATAGISFAGNWFTADSARMVGTPAQRPRVPFVIAANGPKGLRLVTEYGSGWVTTGQDGATGEAWWTIIGDLIRRLEDTAQAVGREPAGIDRYLSLDSGGAYSLQSVSGFEDAVGRASDLGFTDVISHWPRAEGVYAGSEAVLEKVAGSLVSATRS